MSLADAVDGGKPSDPAQPTSFVHPCDRKLHDSNVTFEEYLYYAKKTRDQEKAEQNVPEGGILRQVFRRPSMNKQHATAVSPAESNNGESPNGFEKAPDVGSNSNDAVVNEKTGKRRLSSFLSSGAGNTNVSEDEWVNAARALRTASWGAGFYLITTDILGPYGVGFAIGTLGWGPGIVLYTVFAFMAGYSGYLLWKVFLGLDSYEYPLRTYGDLAYRTMGVVPRHCVNVLQSLQLLLVTGQVIIQNGQGISQTSKFRLCYVVCVIIVVVAGFAVGQVRTLKNFGVISMLAVGLNLMVIFISMGVMAHSPPNYGISVLGSAGSAVDPASITPVDGVYPAIIHYNGLPKSSGFVGAINGLMSGVFAYGGAQLFIEIMAEMRRPWDFLKAMWLAQLFIWAVYLVYGCFVYYYQGQYSFTISYLGLSVYGFQATCNMLSLLSGLIAAGLYGNIGIKVLYNQVFIELFRAPPLTTPRGKYIFAAIVPIYWSVAFVIAGAIPDYFGFVSVIAAFCVVQFSYTFPPMLYLAYSMQKHSMRDGDGFDVATGQTRTSSRGIKRLLKGFFGYGWQQTLLNCWHAAYGLGALCTAALGAYAAIEGLVAAFKIPQVNAFTCQSPLNLNA